MKWRPRVRYSCQQQVSVIRVLHRKKQQLLAMITKLDIIGLLLVNKVELAGKLYLICQEMVTGQSLMNGIWDMQYVS